MNAGGTAAPAPAGVERLPWWRRSGRRNLTYLASLPAILLVVLGVEALQPDRSKAGTDVLAALFAARFLLSMLFVAVSPIVGAATVARGRGGLGRALPGVALPLAPALALAAVVL